MRRTTISSITALIVSALFVLPAQPAAAAPTANRACDGHVSVSLTNVRSGPGLEYNVDLQLPHGSVVTAIGLDLSAKWYIVYLPQENNSIARWIHRRNVRLTNNCVKALQRSAAQSDR
jgi:uncharacterized protein YgiM (DUF1202 family)